MAAVPATVTTDEYARKSKTELLAERKKVLGFNVTVNYPEDPLLIVKGVGQYLYDESGRRYLDGVNNVAHVGHCHPHVVEAGTRQLRTLNTNSRFLHPTIVAYAKHLTSKFPAPLSVCFFVNSGSEANDLALRLARAHTGHFDAAVVNHAYHGHLTSTIELSPYKFEHAGGHPQAEWVHQLPIPDVYRGRHRGSVDDGRIGEAYARDGAAVLAAAHGKGRRIAAFFAESMLSCGGQIILPKGYLRHVYDTVHALGGVCVADEVQVGFGRVGDRWWAFEHQDVVPDIVTVGKAIGNGFPLAAVITTPAIARSFDNGMQYFNTFGGNPVACAVGKAVLEVIEDEKLMENALRVGTALTRGFEELMRRHVEIGDVRGRGLFVGADMVKDRATREPFPEFASAVAVRMKQKGVLIAVDGPFNNVLKMKPPMCFTLANVEETLRVFDEAMDEVRPRFGGGGGGGGGAAGGGGRRHAAADGDAIEASVEKATDRERAEGELACREASKADEESASSSTSFSAPEESAREARVGLETDESLFAGLRAKL